MFNQVHTESGHRHASGGILPSIFNRKKRMKNFTIFVENAKHGMLSCGCTESGAVDCLQLTEQWPVLQAEIVRCSSFPLQLVLSADFSLSAPADSGQLGATFTVDSGLASQTMRWPCFSRRILILVALKWLCVFAYFSFYHTQDSAEMLAADTKQDANVKEEGIDPTAESVIMCSVFQQVNEDDVNRIYFVTPTYTRPVQLADLTRLGQTLLHVANLHWILVEDSHSCSPLVSELLQRLGMSYTHMASPMPDAYRKRKYLPRGVSGRRAALKWLRETNASGSDNAVVYFGDDDNTYDLRLFDEIRDTRGVSMFPVGLIGDWLVSSPVVRDGRVIGFYDSWPVDRLYPVDMAGFAVNVQLLDRYPDANFIYVAGYEEDRFLRSLQLKPADIEVKASNCTQIYVWHTRTVKVQRPSLRPPSLTGTSLETLLQRMDLLNMISLSGQGKKTKMAITKLFQKMMAPLQRLLH